jgi:GMP synthase PP-ATPase subunit
LLRRADAMLIEELRSTEFEAAPIEGIDSGELPRNRHEATSQAFAVFRPVKSVGVMGRPHLRIRGRAHDLKLSVGLVTRLMTVVLFDDVLKWLT